MTIAVFVDGPLRGEMRRDIPDRYRVPDPAPENLRIQALDEAPSPRTPIPIAEYRRRGCRARFRDVEFAPFSVWEESVERQSAALVDAVQRWHRGERP